MSTISKSRAAMRRAVVVQKVLDEAAKTLGMREQPKGSNKGEILVFGGKGGAWCCAWVCTIWHRATGKYPASCGFTRGTGTLWSAAKKDGTRRFVPQVGYIFYKARYENGKKIGGHVGFVERVRLGGKIIETIEGNSDDCVARRIRDVSGMIGFIRPKAMI